MKDFEGFIKNYATRDFIYFFLQKNLLKIYKNQVEKLDEHLVCKYYISFKHYSAWFYT